jgi:hypothetical protein
VKVKDLLLSLLTPDEEHASAMEALGEAGPASASAVNRDAPGVGGPLSPGSSASVEHASGDDGRARSE